MSLPDRRLLTAMRIAAAVTLIIAGVAHAADSLPNPREIEPPPPLECETIEAINAAPGDWVILDARSPSEFDAGHVPTATNVPFDSLDLYADELPAEREAPIVTYCRSGRRAAILRDLLQQRGYTRVSAIPGEQMDRSSAGTLGLQCGD